MLSKRQKFYTSCVKRPSDFLGAIMALLLLSPVFLITCFVLLVCNKNGLSGIFFTQVRPGKDEKIFRVIKFKTMTDEVDPNGNLLPDSERITIIGRFIRSTSIDELPQLINILVGDMSFIGPRPLLVKYLPLYSELQHHRHDVLPGLSGWAQVNGRNSISWQQKFKYDLFYVQNIGLRIDFKIFLMTIKKVVRRSDINNSTGKSKTMDPFNGSN